MDVWILERHSGGFLGSLGVEKIPNKEDGILVDGELYIVEGTLYDLDKKIIKVIVTNSKEIRQ
jgi:hypothetical protein